MKSYWETTTEKQLIWDRQKRLFWERVIDGPVGALVLDRREAAAEILLQQMTERMKEGVNDEAVTKIADQTIRTDPIDECERKSVGFVWIAGAGPGDPDMLTIG